MNSSYDDYVAFRISRWGYQGAKLWKVQTHLMKNNITYAELGRILGYSREHIGRIIRGECPIPEKIFLEYIKNLGSCD